MRSVLLGVVMLFLGSTLTAQEPRTNRVWSLRLQIAACGVTVNTARIAQISSNGAISEWQYVNQNLFIFQWNRDFAPEIAAESDIDYGLHDLLVDYAQTRYVLQLIGVGDTGKTFVKMFWASPVGLAESSIPAPPIRDRNSEWSSEDFAALTAWYNLHTISSANWFKQFSVLGFKSDKKLDLVLKIRGEACKDDDKKSLVADSVAEYRD